MVPSLNKRIVIVRRLLILQVALCALALQLLWNAHERREALGELETTLMLIELIEHTGTPEFEELRDTSEAWVKTDHVETRAYPAIRGLLAIRRNGARASRCEIPWIDGQRLVVSCEGQPYIYQGETRIPFETTGGSSTKKRISTHDLAVEPLGSDSPESDEFFGEYAAYLKGRFDASAIPVFGLQSGDPRNRYVQARLRRDQVLIPIVGTHTEVHAAILVISILALVVVSLAAFHLTRIAEAPMERLIDVDEPWLLLESRPGSVFGRVVRWCGRRFYVTASVLTLAITLGATFDYLKVLPVGVPFPQWATITIFVVSLIVYFSIVESFAVGVITGKADGYFEHSGKAATGTEGELDSTGAPSKPS